MIKFIIDEDMPRSTGKLLEEHGYIIRDIRDCGLRGAEDDKVYEFAQKEKTALITGDRGFGNILRFPLGAHFGIVIANFPNEMSTKEINSQLPSPCCTIFNGFAIKKKCKKTRQTYNLKFLIRERLIS